MEGGEVEGAKRKRGRRLGDDCRDGKERSVRQEGRKEKGRNGRGGKSKRKGSTISNPSICMLPTYF